MEALRSELDKHRQEALDHQSRASEKHAEAEQLRRQLNDVQHEAERIEELTEELNKTRSQLQLNQASNTSIDQEEEMESLKDALKKAQAELEVFKESAGQSATELEKVCVLADIKWC